ncbi:MAG: flagellar hook-associated protein FlgL [Gammaproteobacteria bacterium]|nr:flagellar hook-associated protein FlgL [Gammaproteobacteria bacterium]
MRISSNQLSTSGLREILNRQAELQETQLKIATQRRFLTPSDDPVAATTVLNIETDISLLTQYNRNIDLAKGANQLEETVLTNVENSLFRVKELMISLGNGIYSNEELGAIKAEMQERFEEILSYANTKNAAGDYLFSGFKTDIQPFVKDASGNVFYQGDQGQRELRITSANLVEISDSGFDVFEDVLSGNGKFAVDVNTANTGSVSIGATGYQAPPQFLAEPYQVRFLSPTSYEVIGVNSGSTIVPATTYNPGDTISFNGVTLETQGTPAINDEFIVNPSTRRSIFTTIQSVIDSVDNFVDNDAGRAIYLTQYNNALSEIDSSFTQIDTIRAKVGSRLNAIDAGKDSNDGLILSSQTLLSKLKDLDLVQAASDLTRQTTVLQAAQNSFVRVQNLSIFNFL